MKNRNMALSLMDNISTCSVIFANGIQFNMDRLDPTMKRYTYCYDSTRLKLTEGSVVVAPGSGKYSVCRVVAVHALNQIDVSAPYGYALITDVITIDEDLEEQLTKATDLINESKRIDAKAKMLNQFTGNMSEETRAKLGQSFKAVGITIQGE